MTTWATMVRGLVSRVRHTNRAFSGRALRRRLIPLSVTTAIEVLENRVLLSSTTEVTLSGGDLVVSDVSIGGQADTLTLTFDAANSQFVVSDPNQNLYLSAEGIAGGAVVIDEHTVLVPFESVTGNIQVDMQGGDDNLTIDSTLAESVTFGTPDRSLIINSGSGNDTINLDASISFALDGNLNVDLQYDSGATDIDAIHVGPDANLLLSGSGAATLKASGNIALASGSSVVTVNGNLTIEANQQAVPTVGNSIGVDVNNAMIQSTGTGLVTVRGRGGDESGGLQYGVYVSQGGIIAGGTTGLLTVQGTGGDATGLFSNNFGVYVTDSNSSITSSGGDVLVIGTGGGTGDFSSNNGVVVFAASHIAAGGSGAVTVVGTGSDTPGVGGTNYGVVLDSDSSITSNGGDVQGRRIKIVGNSRICEAPR
ncbi:MAG: hypothetical protein EXS05_19105 [Planctomycetaceae bacterium]|nr:hypothetical protein [Planctomycetaceae bacterium]